MYGLIHLPPQLIGRLLSATTPKVRIGEQMRVLALRMQKEGDVRSFHLSMWQLGR